MKLPFFYAEKITSSQDIGGRMVRQIQDCIVLGVEYKGDDPIIKIIANAINDAEEFDDAVNSLQYAINQLQRAKDALNGL